jgi:hypothetical protein
MPTYDKKEAQQIINTRLCEFGWADDGIRPILVSTENAEFDQLTNWTPSCELDGDDAPDPQIVPALPFPFNASHLAAWMLHGCGYFVREQYGDWADGPDQKSMVKLGTQATKAKQALKQAFDAYRAAEQVVGAYDTMYSENIQELENRHGHWPDDKEARQRIKQAHLDADEYESDRRKKMVNQLLAVSQVTLVESHILGQTPLASTMTTAQDTATPAPMVAANDGPAPLPAVANWKMQIQAEATALVLRLRKSGANPTRHSILDTMAQWCRDNDVTTSTKINPSANYLRTHVLGGKHWEVPN